MDDTYSRFSRVAENYALYRPRYPSEVVELLNAKCGFSPTQTVADIGSGTGLLAELFLKNGNTVYGVEPNAEMRSAAEHFLHSYPSFTSITATAEATTLANHSVDLITVGQAFHWFKPAPARQEFLRVLIPSGWVVLIWNLEQNNGSPFATAFERFWQTHIDLRNSFNSELKRPDYINQFFGASDIKEASFDNPQVCDFAALKGRVLSASNSPASDDPRYSAMLDELRAIFGQYEEGGKVTLEYVTRIVYGQLLA